MMFKRNLFYLFVLALLHLGIEVSAQGDYSFQYSKKKSTLISSHRGGSIEAYPENCLETIQYFHTKGNFISEVDLSLTKDGEIVLMHDDYLERTTTGAGKLEHFTLEELQQFQLIDASRTPTPFRISTFKSLLVWAKKNKAYLSIDFKKSVPYQKAIDMIREVGMQSHCILISYNVSQALELHHLAPEMMLSVSMRNEEEFNRMMATQIPTNKMIAFTGTRISPKSLNDKIHEKDILVMFGTLGNIDKSAAAKKSNEIYQDLERDGVDVFATDRALEVMKVINKK